MRRSCWPRSAVARGARAALGPRAEELGAPGAGARRASRRAVVAAAGGAASLVALRAFGPPAPPDALTVRFLDVGQGDATLIQHPDGTAVLFDGGPPEAGMARLLRRAGVRELAAVVATHASRDHHGGLRRGARSASRSTCCSTAATARRTRPSGRCCDQAARARRPDRAGRTRR